MCSALFLKVDAEMQNKAIFPRNKLVYQFNHNQNSAVMVNFVCQLDAATVGPDIWPNILVVSGRVFLYEINI